MSASESLEEFWSVRESLGEIEGVYGEFQSLWRREAFGKDKVTLGSFRSNWERFGDSLGDLGES